MNEKQQGSVSKRLDEVLAWKDAIYRDVADLPVREALKRLAEEAKAAVQTSGLPPLASRR